MRPCLGWLAALFTASVFSADFVEERLPDLPEPVSNNAVALLPTPQGPVLYSFMGLGEGRTHSDVHSHAWRLPPGASEWEALPDVPGGAGRLASVAVVAAGQVWVFGGYTVAADHSEVSTPGTWRLDPATAQWHEESPMPIPVDDATAQVLEDRWIYLVSGWHDLGNVNLVQVLDTQTGEWRQATPYPGEAVFGHAGGLVDRRLVVCGGVRIAYPADESSRRFLSSAECWTGSIDQDDVRRIQWRPLSPHPGPPRYRMAAGPGEPGRMVFLGGSANPYNYDGVGYNGEPSQPESVVLELDLASGRWQVAGRQAVPTMDHRGLLFHEGQFFVVGGMQRDQVVTARVTRLRPKR